MSYSCTLGKTRQQRPPFSWLFWGVVTVCCCSVAALATLGSWESCRNIPVEVGHSDEHWQENPTIVTFDWLVKTKENWKNMLSPATTRTIVQYIAGEHHPPNNKNQVFDHCQKKLSVQLEFSCHIYIYIGIRKEFIIWRSIPDKKRIKRNQINS